jgi:hypothetical protein
MSMPDKTNTTAPASALGVDPNRITFGVHAENDRSFVVLHENVGIHRKGETVRFDAFTDAKNIDRLIALGAIHPA